jgi:hypothetical protein
MNICDCGIPYAGRPVCSHVVIIWTEHIVYQILIEVQVYFVMSLLRNAIR